LSCFWFDSQAFSDKISANLLKDDEKFLKILDLKTISHYKLITFIDEIYSCGDFPTTSLKQVKNGL
jgi:hypothetical protein